MRPSYDELVKVLEAARDDYAALRRPVDVALLDELLTRAKGDPLPLYVAHDEDNGDMKVIVPDSLPEVEIIFLDLSYADHHGLKMRGVEHPQAIFNRLEKDRQYEVHTL